MGQLPSSQEDPEQQNQIQLIDQKHHFEINCQAKVRASLNTIQNFTLGEIRKIYDNFRRLSGYPFIDVTLFCHLVPFPRVSANNIFQEFCRDKSYMNFYEFFCTLVLASYANIENKLRFLFMIFDLDKSNTIDRQEVVIIVLSFVTGYCRLTGCTLINTDQIKAMAKTLFQNNFVKVDQNFTFKEIKDWVETNNTCVKLFNRFEISKKVKEQINTFKPTKTYSSQETKYIFDLLDLTQKNKKFFSDLKYIMLQQTSNISNQQVPNYQNKHISLQTLQDTERIRNSLRQLQTYREKSKIEEIKQKLPSIKVGQSLDTTKRKKNQKMIVVDGYCLSKNDIYHLKDYFDKLSDKGEQMNIKQFFKAFQDKPHLKGVLPGLFNYFDRKQKGTVNFQQFIQSVFPSVNKKGIQTVTNWTKSYSQLQNAFENQTKVQSKEQIQFLPLNSKKRYQEIFGLFDTNQKGYITIDDLKQNLKLGFTSQNIEDMFKTKDGFKFEQMDLQKFIKLMIPSNFDIHPNDLIEIEQERLQQQQLKESILDDSIQQ